MNKNSARSANQCSLQTSVRFVTGVCAMLLVLSTPAAAQQQQPPLQHDAAHVNHDQSTQTRNNNNEVPDAVVTVTSHNALPTQPGQSAFAAIAEIVALLDSDPDTDWSTVNIDVLRSHLVDMDQMLLHAKTQTVQVNDQRIQYHVTGKGDTLSAIRNMVPAHASVVQGLTGWSITTTARDDGATVSIQTDDPAAITRLKALGFHGFLTIGAHHQVHHLQMARGQGH